MDTMTLKKIESATFYLLLFLPLSCTCLILSPKFSPQIILYNTQTPPQSLFHIIIYFPQNEFL